MLDQVPDRLFWFQVLLATIMTITTDNFGLAIKAVLFFSFL